MSYVYIGKAPTMAQMRANAQVLTGDTFVRVGETDAWEVTVSTFPDVWTLRRGAEVMATRAETLLDPAQWVRVERL